MRSSMPCTYTENADDRTMGATQKQQQRMNVQRGRREKNPQNTTTQEFQCPGKQEKH